MNEPTDVVGRLPPVPSGTELVRPFLPTRDLELSKSFYETLGFQKLLDRSERSDLPSEFGRVRKRLHCSPGGFESRTSSILAVCCGMWHNGGRAQRGTKVALMRNA